MKLRSSLRIVAKRGGPTRTMSRVSTGDATGGASSSAVITPTITPCRSRRSNPYHITSAYPGGCSTHCAIPNATNHRSSWRVCQWNALMTPGYVTVKLVWPKAR